MTQETLLQTLAKILRYYELMGQKYNLNYDPNMKFIREWIDLLERNENSPQALQAMETSFHHPKIIDGTAWEEIGFLYMKWSQRQGAT